ncbi:MAG TPA: sugar phosphate isomerase/epimerase [Gammaproteobacteria bacterium]|nr:sugar phosphate isomerase/epimerase [Gammaproteobacteria bacterium]
MSLTRRRLLSRSASLAAAAVGASPRLLRAAEPRGPGIQLWTVRDPLAADLEGTLRELRTIGFTEVEPAGFMGLSAAEFRKRLDDAGLAAPSVQLDLGGDGVDAAFADAHALGAHYAVSSMLRAGTGPLPFEGPRDAPPGLAPPMRTMTLDDALRTAELANRVGERARRAGLQYAYHNHAFELVPQANGAIPYDVLIERTDPELVRLELDCGWLVVGGGNPVDYLERYPGRVPLLHVKDFLPAPNAERGRPGPRYGAELGRGTIDYAPILAAARARDLEHYYVEQEGPYTRMSPLDSAAVAYDYLRKVSGA